MRYLIRTYILFVFFILFSCGNKSNNEKSENRFNSADKNNIKQDSLIKSMENELLTLIQKKDSITKYLSGKAKSKIYGCFEGTQNQAILNLRTDKSFDILWTGFLFVELFEGNYEIKKDTVFLTYSTPVANRIGQKMIIQKDKISSAKTENGIVSFYYGECKGLN